MLYYCCFSLGGNLDFQDFLQKIFIPWTPVLNFSWAKITYFRWRGGKDVQGSFRKAGQGDVDAADEDEEDEGENQSDMAAKQVTC